MWNPAISAASIVDLSRESSRCSSRVLRCLGVFFVLLVLAGCDSEPPATPITLAPDPARQWPAVVAGDEGTVPAMAELRSFEGHTDAIVALAVSPGGARLASVSGDRSVRLWEVATGNLLQTVPVPQAVFENTSATALFADEGRELILADAQSIIRIDLQTAAINGPGFPLTAPLHSLAISSDSEWLALVNKDGTCQLLAADLQSKPIALTGLDNQARAVAFFPSGHASGSSQLMVGLSGETMRIFSMEELLKDPAAKGSSPIWSRTQPSMVAPELVAVSADSAQVAVASENHILRSGPAPEVKGHNIVAITIDFSRNRSIAYLPGGRYLAAYGGDCMMKLCDTQDMALAGETTGFSGPVSCGLISPGAQFAVTGYRDGKIKTFSMPKPLGTKPDYPKKILALRTNKDFDGLETLVDKLREERLRKSPEIDHPLLYYFYLLLASPDEHTPEGLAAVDTFIADYRAAKPDSAAAMLLEARRHIQTGWEARGSGSGFTVTQEGAQTFQEELAAAKQLVLRAMKLKPNDPAVYAEMILVCKGTGESKQQVFEYLNKGIEVDPLYYPLYEMTADYLLPRWYGSPGEVERWALAMADKIGGDDGLVIHARIALRVLHYESFDYLKAGAFSLEKLTAALPLLRKRYARSLPELNFAAMIACLADDRSTAHALFQEIGNERRMPEVWKSSADFSAMMRWADPATVASQEKLQIEIPQLLAASMAFTPEGHLFLGFSSRRDSGFTTFNSNTGATIENQQLAQSDFNFVLIGSLAKRVAFFERLSSTEFFDGNTTAPFSIWNRGAGEQQIKPLVFEYEEAPREMGTALFSPDESTCFFFDGRGYFHLCDSDTLNVLGTMKLEPGEGGPRVALDNHRMLVGSQSGELKVWDFKDQSKQAVASIRGIHRKARINRIARMPDGSGVLIASEQAGLIKVTLPNFEIIEPANKDVPERSIGTGYGQLMLVSPDGQWLVGTGGSAHQVSAEHHAIQVWDVATLSFVRQFSGHLEEVLAICFSPDGKTLASAASDRTIRLWDMTQVKPVK